MDRGFLAEVVDGAKVHMLGQFVSERWAKTSALGKVKEILASREGRSATDTAASADDDADDDDDDDDYDYDYDYEDADDLVAPMITEDVREALRLAFDMLDVLPAFWRWSKTQNPAPSGDGEA